MKEKRKHPRMPMTGWVEIRGRGADEAINGYVSNVSLSGMAVYTKELLPPGTSVLLSLHFFGPHRLESVRALWGEVISSVKMDKSFQIGIRFREPVTNENEPALFTYLTHGEASKTNRAIDFYPQRNRLSNNEDLHV
jgi:hypothetical protein